MSRPLLISHELSYSGAPLALLNLAKALRRLGENPIVAPLAEGPLAATFRESGIEIATTINLDDVSFVIANTIVSVPVALRLKRPDRPVAAWIHESMYSFLSLDIAPERCGLQDLDLVLVPSKFQVDELGPFLRPGRTYQLRNVVAQEWFRPPGDEARVAVCGMWEIRKGQSQLLDLVQRSGTDCMFKFIGAARPTGHADADMSRHIFMGPVDPSSARFEIARCGGLVSCSTSETQALSAIEALMAGRPVLLSDIKAHRTLADLVPNVFLFDQESPRSFRENYGRLVNAMPDDTVARRASTTARALFGEAAFDQRLMQIVKILRRVPAAVVEVEHSQDP